MTHDILYNLYKILSRIEESCLKANRNPEEVKLLLATKTVPADKIRIALQAGQVLIAENKVQELKEKYEALKEIPHTNHFIGHLQSNKIKDVLKYGVTCIQSLDRIELAEKLHQKLLADNKTIEVLIQVNTSNESSKFGIHPDDAIELVTKVSQLSTLKIKGLMTIGLLSNQTDKVRECFKILKALQQQVIALHLPGVQMDELSMGMSGDMEIAIEEGSTIIRIGTAIFGQRNRPDSYYWNEAVTVK
ncbi:YggS family pyridoxal phosphate-dependent enzyme [Polluticaenibacter yanchengensis]|uniref:Pyridoxal phosphate homeostasis protein n=1 Tax=Polluticaenibacter yanchengensis TaxID=3014562 RepID=A0ABT4UJ41_9BACT|nr:YggS family pyridoxal phosphate-dependent enzyme [Chitinophagaceae bacterium LY-5]